MADSSGIIIIGVLVIKLFVTINLGRKPVKGGRPARDSV